MTDIPSSHRFPPGLNPDDYSDSTSSPSGTGPNVPDEPPEDRPEPGFPDADSWSVLGIETVDYAVRSTDGNERPVVHIYGTPVGADSPESDVVHVEVHGFEPYFYATVESVTDDNVDDSRIVRTEAVDNETLRSEEVIKVVTKLPKHVGQLRDDFDHYEADIPFPNRFLIDKDLASGIRVPARESSDGTLQVHHDEVTPVTADVQYQVHQMDIEVDDRNGFPSAESAEEPIICLTTHDSISQQYITWLFDVSEGPVDASAITSELHGYEPVNAAQIDFEIRAFEEEAQMLEAYLDYLDETDPSVLTGWNFEDFDIQYVYNRLEKLDRRNGEKNLSPNRLSRIGEAHSSYWGVDIKGRVVFDLLEGLKRNEFTSRDSYRLDDVGEDILGAGKQVYTGDLGELWEEDPATLVQYNLRDVEITVGIEDHEELIDFWTEVKGIAGCQLPDAPIPGSAVDVYILQQLHGEHILPTKGTVDSDAEFEGGAVFDPYVGVEENVATLDLASLYPMAMVTINASPETKVSTDYEGETHVAPNGTHFQKEPDGKMRTIITELLERRDALKTKRDANDPESAEFAKFDRQQASVKVLMNALFGVQGWDRFRLYDPEMSAAVTSTGREVIKHTADVIESGSDDVIYGDTDSCLVSLEDDLDKDACIERARTLEAQVNESYDQFARERLDADDHRFDIEFEKLYRTFFQAGKKKRYAGEVVWSEGKHVTKVDITGFEYKRSDIAPYTKETQKHVIELIVNQEDDDEIRQYVYDRLEAIRDGHVDVNEVAIPGGINKELDSYDAPTAHVRGAKYANLLLGTNFGKDSQPKRVYLRDVDWEWFEDIEAERGLDPQQNDLYADFKREPDVICYDYIERLPGAFKIDWEKMIRKGLKGPIERVTAPIGISWSSITSNQEQTGIGEFL